MAVLASAGVESDLSELDRKSFYLDVKQGECQAYEIETFGANGFETPSIDLEGKFIVQSVGKDGTVILIGKAIDNVIISSDKLKALITSEKAKGYKTFEIPVSWEMSATAKVEALTLEEAKEDLLRDGTPLPVEAEYVYASYRIEEELLAEQAELAK